MLRPGEASRAQKARVGLLCYLFVLAVVLLYPTPTVAVGTVSGLESWLLGAGAPASIVEPGRVELALNAAMFAPLPVLATLAWPHRPWTSWVTYAFIGSAGVEVIQALLLSARSAQHADVVANTSGALAGALLGLFLTRRKLNPTAGLVIDD